jgi:hypothetical protein
MFQTGTGSGCEKNHGLDNYKTSTRLMASTIKAGCKRPLFPHADVFRIILMPFILEQKKLHPKIIVSDTI